jgi:hypothetical protein
MMEERVGVSRSKGNKIHLLKHAERRNDKIKIQSAKETLDIFGPS